MKMQTRFMLFGCMCLCLGVGSARGQFTFNVMPMGDSVTARGGAPESSYRYWLFKYLTNAGYNPNFVGRTRGNNGTSDGPPANLWPQDAYEGGSTWNAAPPTGDAWTTGTGVQDASSAANELNNGNPSIVLLDLGANDVNATEFGDTTLKTNLLQVQQNLETIMSTFQQANPSTRILLAVSTPWVVNPPDPVVNRFMADLGSAVSKAAKAERKAGLHVTVVNLHGGFNPHINRDTKDGTHPDIKGEQMIAKKFFNALRPMLKNMKKEGL